MKIRKISNYSNNAKSDSLPIGSIILFSGLLENIPSNYFICDGSEKSRVDCKKLFNVIGTIYGTGDGSTTFNLPDYRDRVPVGLGNEDIFNTLGKTGGSRYLQDHTHSMIGARRFSGDIKNSSMSSIYASSAILGSDYVCSYSTTKPNTTTGDSGNVQPYIVTNYIIKAFDDINIEGKVLNQQSDSQEDTYSCEYINNKIKTIVNTNQSVKTGRIIDGKEEYVIRLNLGAMPNATNKTITLPIKLKEKLLTREFHIWILSATELGTEPNNGMTYFISGTNGDQLEITTTNDKSRFTGYAELYYIDR